MTAAQRKAVANHRKRLKRQGLVRLEVLAPESDADLIRALAKALRDGSERAARIRARVRDAVGPDKKPSLLELLADPSGVDLDEYLIRDRDFGRQTDL